MKGLWLLIKAHWNGSAPFPKSYLFVVFLIAMASRKLTMLSFDFLRWNESLTNKICLAYIVSFSVLVLLWCGVGALRYLANKASAGATLIGLIVVLGLFIQTLYIYSRVAGV
jgi:hypothetical protein